MQLNITSSYEELQNHPEVLQEEGYYYICAYVFAGSRGNWNKINTDAFHLWNIRHGDAKASCTVGIS